MSSKEYEEGFDDGLKSGFQFGKTAVNELSWEMLIVVIVSYFVGLCIGVFVL